MKHIYIIGSKGIPAQYGGFETFVEHLTKKHQHNHELKYHVSCKNSNLGDHEHNNAHCFNINVPHLGGADAVLYDFISLIKCCKYIKNNNIEHPIVYILACRLGLLLFLFARNIHKADGEIYINPDGHDWMRTKYNNLIRRYWKISERYMVKCADLVICDSVSIQEYIKAEYARYLPVTHFIPYGGDNVNEDKGLTPNALDTWLKRYNAKRNYYYLVVGRLVPENNIDIILREFTCSITNKKLLIITNDNKSYQKSLVKKYNLNRDERVLFTGSLYNIDLLNEVRENSFCYIHGHEVGGTNPSLLEALNKTKISLLHDNRFNREVADDAALYWTKDKGSLMTLLNQIDILDDKLIAPYTFRAKKRIKDIYNWQTIADEYQNIFGSCEKNG